MSSVTRTSPTPTVDVFEQLYLAAESVEPSVDNAAVYDSGKFRLGYQNAVKYLLSIGPTDPDWTLFLYDAFDAAATCHFSTPTDLFVGYYTMMGSPTDMTATLVCGHERFPAKLVPGRITFPVDGAFVLNIMPTRFQEKRVEFSHPAMMVKDCVYMVGALFQQEVRSELCGDMWVHDLADGRGMYLIGGGMTGTSPTPPPLEAVRINKRNWMLSSHARRMQIWREKAGGLMQQMLQRVANTRMAARSIAPSIRVMRLDEVTVVDGAFTAEETAHLRALSMAAVFAADNELGLHSSPETAALLQTALRRANLGGPVAIPPMVTLGRSRARGLHMDQSLCKGSTASVLAFLDDAGGGGGHVAFYSSTHEPPRVVVPRAGRLVLFSVRLLHEVFAPRGDKFIAACEVSGW